MEKFILKGIKGCLEGREFPLITDKPVSLGRSYNNNIIFSSPYVSGFHIILHFSADGITLENVSSGMTSVDGVRLSQGEKKKIFAGQQITLGSFDVVAVEVLQENASNTETVLEDASNSETVLANAPSSDDSDKNEVREDASNTETALANASNSDDSDKNEVRENTSTVLKNVDELKTQMMATQIVTAEELEELHDIHGRERNIKVGLYFVVLILVLAGLITLYKVFVYKVPEKQISFPLQKNGKIYSNLFKFKRFTISPDCDVMYPNPPGCKISESGNEVVINTFFGRDADVPLRMRIMYYREPASLHMDRRAYLEKWINGKFQKDVGWNFELIQPVRFIGSDNGIPYLSITYNLTEKNMAWVGNLMFWRFEDWVFFVFKEIPTSERFRGETVLQMNPVWFGDKPVKRYWDGCSKLLPGTANENLLEAKALLAKNSPGMWEKAAVLLRNALIKNQSGKFDKNIYDMGVTLLESLRLKQHNYYNAQKIAYLKAEKLGAPKELARIGNGLKSIFTSEDDSRFYKVRQNKWD